MTDKPANELIHGELNCETAANDNAVIWRCFHCNEAFTEAQEKEAAEHFGSDSSQTPVCLMRVPGERHLIKQFRKIYDELQMYRNDDNRYMRIIEGMEVEYKAEMDRKEKELRDSYFESYERLNKEHEYLRQFKDLVNLQLARNRVPQGESELNRLEWVFDNYQKIEPQAEAEPEEKQPLTFFTVVGLFAILGGGYFLGMIGGVFNVLLPVVAGVGIVSALLFDVFNFDDDDDDDDDDDEEEEEEEEEERGFMS